MEKSVLESELVLARKRQVDQEHAVADQEAVLQHAQRTKLPTVERLSRLKLERLRKTLKETTQLVSELEAASGALPLAASVLEAPVEPQKAPVDPRKRS